MNVHESHSLQKSNGKGIFLFDILKMFSEEARCVYGLIVQARSKNPTLKDDGDIESKA